MVLNSPFVPEFKCDERYFDILLYYFCQTILFRVATVADWRGVPGGAVAESREGVGAVRVGRPAALGDDVAGHVRNRRRRRRRSARGVGPGRRAIGRVANGNGGRERPDPASVAEAGEFVRSARELPAASAASSSTESLTTTTAPSELEP